MVYSIRLKPKKPKFAARFAVPEETFEALCRAGADRQMTANRLAALILQTVCRDDLFAAILDNVPVVPPPPPPAMPPPTPAATAGIIVVATPVGLRSMTPGDVFTFGVVTLLTGILLVSVWAGQ